MADLDALQVVQDSQPLTLLDPYTDNKLLNDEGKPMVIYMHGAETKLAKSVESEITRGDKQGKKISDAEQERRLYKKLARLTDRFENVQMGGELLVYDYQTAYNLYEKYPFILIQVAEFVTERSNFLGNSQKPLPTTLQQQSG